MPIAFNCPLSIGCPGSDYPVSNFSSEEPDGLQFISIRWPKPNGGGGSTGGGGGGIGPGSWPPLGDNGTGGVPGDNPTNDWPCIGIANSPISQQDADFCANITAQTCGEQTGDCPVPFWPTVDPTIDPNHPLRILTKPLFYNIDQTCSVACPNGSLFTVTIPAGKVANASQILANDIANSLACNYADTHKVCLTPAPHRPGHPPYDPLHLTGRVGWCCGGDILTGDPVFAVNGPGYTFLISSGNLPTGVSMFTSSGPSDPLSTASLIGLLDTPGTYDFTVQAVNTFGSNTSHAYTIGVIGLQSTSLPDGSVGDEYLPVQLVALGTTGQATFTLLGSMPAGLSLSSSGLISGTPTDVGVETFAVGIQDSAGHSCQEFLSITTRTPCFTDSTVLPGAQAWVGFYSYGFTPINPPGPGNSYVGSIVGGSLPPGIGIDDPSIPSIAGFPQGNGGTYDFTLQLQEVDGSMSPVGTPCQQNFQIVLDPPPPVNCGGFDTGTMSLFSFGETGYVGGDGASGSWATPKLIGTWNNSTTFFDSNFVQAAINVNFCNLDSENSHAFRITADADITNWEATATSPGPVFLYAGPGSSGQFSGFWDTGLINPRTHGFVQIIIRLGSADFGPAGGSGSITLSIQML